MIKRIILSVTIARVNLTLCVICVTSTIENLGQIENFNGEDGPTESYRVVSSLFMAYISEALRHFLIFHERFYGAPNFLRLLNKA